MSSFSSFIQEIPGLAVDSFKNLNFEHCSTFFLSHCHADHMQNLFQGFTSFIDYNPNLSLYCSGETGIILRNKLSSYGEASHYLLNQVIKTVPINQEFTVIVNGMPVYVTAIRANHCAGSCMFLFKTQLHNVLYTGDFRFHHYELGRIDALHDDDGYVLPLDTIYLDTTFLTQITANFPSRKKALYLIMNEIDDYFNYTGGNGVVHITRPSNLGSEIVIKTLATKYGRPIHVEWDSFNMYKGINQVFPHLTPDPNETNIHMCKPNKPGTAYMCKDPNGLKIHASALWYAIQESPDWVQREPNGKVKIAHSMHASRTELEAFINYFKPSQAVALVSPDGYTFEQVQNELDQLVESALL